MKCEEIYGLLSAKLDHALTEAEEACLQAHLDTCADCRRLYEAMFSIEQQTKALAQPAPEGLKRGVLYRIRQEAGGKQKKRRFFGLGTGIGAAAAILVLLIGVGVVPLPGRKASGVQDKALQMNAPPAIQTGEALRNDATQSFSVPRLEGEPPMQAEPDAMEDNSPTEPDYYYLDGSKHVNLNASKPRDPQRSVDQASIDACQTLSAQAEAAVLYYSEFSPETLFALLQEYEPELYRRLEDIRPVDPTEALGSAEGADSSMLLYPADYQTVLAVQEWLVQNLPHSESMDTEADQAQTELFIRMEQIDPNSGCLNRIIRWRPNVREILWPETWPERWALRLRTGENWALFFPAEDYRAADGDLAYLAFPAPIASRR